MSSKECIATGAETETREFNPLDGVMHHWGQAEEQFRVFREQFPDAEAARQFIGAGIHSGAFEHGQTVRECIANLSGRAAESPGNVKLTSLSAVMDNLLACGGFSSAINNHIPGYPGHHDSYGNYYTSIRAVAPMVIAINRTVYSLGLGPDGSVFEDSPVQQFAQELKS